MINKKSYLFIILLGCMSPLATSVSLKADDKIEENRQDVEYDIDQEDDLADLFESGDIDIEDIIVWEQTHPPSFTEFAKNMLWMQAEQHSQECIAAGIALTALAYFFREHLWENKGKYALGLTSVIAGGLFYGKWQFDQAMNSSKK